jgi:hypothetical protein
MRTMTNAVARLHGATTQRTGVYRLIVLLMESLSSSEMWVKFCEATRCNIPEHNNRHARRRENLKYHLIHNYYISRCVTWALWKDVGTNAKISWFHYRLSDCLLLWWNQDLIVRETCDNSYCFLAELSAPGTKDLPLEYYSFCFVADCLVRGSLSRCRVVKTIQLSKRGIFPVTLVTAGVKVVCKTVWLVFHKCLRNRNQNLHTDAIN